MSRFINEPAAGEGERFTLAIAAPLQVGEFRDYLESVDDATPLPAGLGGTSVTHLTRGLLARGWTLRLFTFDPDLAREVTFEGPRLKVWVGPYRPRHRARDFFRSERSYLRDAIRRERPDLVSAHWTYEFALGALESGVSCVVSARDAPWAILRYMPSSYRAVRLLMALRVARRASDLTVASEHIAAHFRRFLGYRGRIHLCPNGLEDWVFELGRTRTAGREPGSPVRFATVLNGWGRLKNASPALKAFRAVRRSLPGARLLMFGSDYGPGGEAEAWATTHRCADGVSFVGPLPYQELLTRLAREADVLVHPALEESFSMAAAEGMALGLPVIGGRKSGAVPSTLEGGKAGVLVDVRSPAVLARAMLELGRDAAVRATLGAAARESAWRRFSLGPVIDAYERAFEAALAGQRDSP